MSLNRSEGLWGLVEQDWIRGGWFLQDGGQGLSGLEVSADLALPYRPLPSCQSSTSASCPLFCTLAMVVSLVMHFEKSVALSSLLIIDCRS